MTEALVVILLHALDKVLKRLAANFNLVQEMQVLRDPAVRFLSRLVHPVLDLQAQLFLVPVRQYAQMMNQEKLLLAQEKPLAPILKAQIPSSKLVIVYKKLVVMLF